jgi:hypothetical protein
MRPGAPTWREVSSGPIHISVPLLYQKSLISPNQHTFIQNRPLPVRGLVAYLQGTPTGAG